LDVVRYRTQIPEVTISWVSGHIVGSKNTGSEKKGGSKEGRKHKKWSFVHGTRVKKWKVREANVKNQRRWDS